MLKSTQSAGQMDNAEEAKNCLPAARRSNPAGQFAPTPDHSRAAAEAYNGLSALVQNLAALHRRRTFIIKSQQRIDRGCEQYLATLAGDSKNLSKKERKKIWAEVARVKRMVEANMKPAVSAGRAGQIRSVEKAHRAVPARKISRKGNKEGGLVPSAEEAPANVPPSLPDWVDSGAIIVAAMSRSSWDEMRKAVEAEMTRLVKQLPVFEFWTGIRGLGPLGLATIVGEAGDLSNYPDKGKLWKRMGLAVINGKRQRKCKNPEKAQLHGYNPSRRAAVFVIAEKMAMHQMTGDKDEDGNDPSKTKKPAIVKAHPTGPYGVAYYHRRAVTSGREGWTPKHQHFDALRYMSKKLLAHLLAEWKNWS